MKGLKVDLHLSFLSGIEAQLYHDTLPLPPHHSAGNGRRCFGQNIREALSWAKSVELMVGCIGTSGSGKDLWNYIKIKMRQEIDEANRAVILRTFLADMRLSAYYAAGMMTQ